MATRYLNLSNKKTIGILGAGQLGLMLATSLKSFGSDVRVIAYDPDPNACGHREADESIISSYTDQKALAELAARCDYVTYEFEHLPAESFVGLAEAGKLRPGLKALETSQHRAREKDFIKSCGLPLAPYMILDGKTEINLKDHVESFGYPLMAKTLTGGYDGKGQWLLRSQDDLGDFLATCHAGTPLVLERLVDLEAEASVIIARNAQGEIKTLPVFENKHRNSILDTTIVPAMVSPEHAEIMRDCATTLAHSLDLCGILAVEFFIGTLDPQKGPQVLVNEYAPRPHNSGHVTRRATSESQFDLLSRVLLDLPFVEITSNPGHFIMQNLLGDFWYRDDRLLEPDWAKLSTATFANGQSIQELFVYGKGEPRKKRKMGHVIVHAESREAAQAACKTLGI